MTCATTSLCMGSDMYNDISLHGFQQACVSHPFVIDLHGKRDPDPSRPQFGDGDVDIGLAAMCRLGDEKEAEELRTHLTKHLSKALNSVPVRKVLLCKETWKSLETGFF